MKIIGVTGGVGAGKSTVLNYMRQKYGAEVIQADEVSHQLMEPGTEVYEQIRKTFGEEILTADGKIDRKKLGAIVFAAPKQLQILNRIVHPATRTKILSLLKEAGMAGKSCAVVEAALFLEENYGAFCDETWYIYTNEEQRRERLKASRGYTDERVDQIFQSQRTHKEFLAYCQAVIDNNGTAEETCRQIDRRMNNR
jgi:dephospho-CoA kinase